MRKKKIIALLYKDYFLIFLLSLPPLGMLLYTQDLIHTHDGLVHLPRQAAYYKALLDGQFPVRWAGDLNYGYGMPLFNFIYHFPYVIGSLFLFMGSSLVGAFKFSLSVSYILAGIFMLLFAREFFEDRRRAFLVTILYQFAPFRFVELLTRGSYGEVYTYTFLPLVLYFLFRLFKQKTFLNFFFTSLSIALLVISHNSVSLLFFGVIALFAALFARGKKNMIVALLVLICGLLLSSYYWIPAVLEHKYTYGNLYMGQVYLDHFPSFFQFFMPNIFNVEALKIHAVPVYIGVFQSVAIVLVLGRVIFYRFQKMLDKRIYLFSFLLLIGSFLLMSEVSKPLWGASFSMLLRQFQFPWRMMSVVVFATSLLGISFFTVKQFSSKWSIAGLVFFIILSSVAFWFPQEGYDHVSDTDYWNYPLTTTYYGETDLIWSAGPAGNYPPAPIEIIDGMGEVVDFSKNSYKHSYIIHTEADAQILDNTQYFPGWRVYIDGQKTPIEFQDINHRGLITYKVPPGDHVVLARFEESRVRYFADVLSLITLVGLLASSAYMTIKERFK